MPANVERMNVSKQAIKAATRGNTTLRENGTAPASGYPRAAALPKVRTLFEGAHLFRKVRILENPDDSFEDAHLFPRCAPAHAVTENGSGNARLPIADRPANGEHTSGRVN